MKATSYLLLTYPEFTAFFLHHFLRFHASALLDFASFPTILPWEFCESTFCSSTSSRKLLLGELPMRAKLFPAMHWGVGGGEGV